MENYILAPSFIEIRVNTDDKKKQSQNSCYAAEKYKGKGVGNLEPFEEQLYYPLHIQPRHFKLLCTVKCMKRS